MGDVLSLIEKAEEAADEDQARELLEKFSRDQFTLQDFLDQLKQIRKLGPLDQILGMLPQLGAFKGLNQVNVDEKQISHLEAIIYSMTPKERAQHKLIDGSRRKRIARGSGRPVSEVNRLLKQYVQMRRMMKKMGGGKLGKQMSRLGWPFS
jgi:signal recognition particle subunit SRP54